MLSEYHKKYKDKSDDELARRLAFKKNELEVIKRAVQPVFNSPILKVAVMGCGDKRFVKGHRDIFSQVFDSPVEITTFDVMIDHLAGKSNVVQHDCTHPLPGGPYDITFAHVLLRFIPKDGQLAVVMNSFNALKPGGIAIHVLDPEDYENNLVIFEDIKQHLADRKNSYQVVELEIGIALVITKG